MAPRDRRALIEKIPHSEMVYPDSFLHRIKYYFWYYYTPYHPTVRDSVIALSLIKNRGRQPFLLGSVAPHLSIEEFVAYLIENGYAYHRVAWEDDGEVVSLRLVNDFVFQYHVRVFEDREVRGHYEYTPECYPLWHLWDVGREDRREEFLALLGERVIPHSSGDQSDYQWEFLPLKRRLWE
ncbi:hypothetical protein HYW60_04075 [Candidatus Kaiserbacteria bacterium]|nr:hypothetical protein [Candidatus Kaiserbacteria bacterium]